MIIIYAWMLSCWFINFFYLIEEIKKTDKKHRNAWWQYFSVYIFSPIILAVLVPTYLIKETIVE